MRHIGRVLFSLFIVCFLAAATPLPKDDFSPAATRAQLLSLLDQFVSTELKVDPPAEPGSKQDILIQHYIKTIKPKEEASARLLLEYKVYHQLIDAGLYTSDAEQADWTAKEQAALDGLSGFQTDEQLTKDTETFGKLAEGLPGEFARIARMEAEQLVFEQFPPAQKPLLVEDNQLETQIEVIANQSTEKVNFEKSGPQFAQTLMAFFAGKMSFDDASKKLEELEQTGELAYGHDIVEHAKTQLNRSAVIKTLLAQSKGYPSHAAFAIAGQAIAHAPEFKTKDALLKFLYGLLDATDAVTKRYYDVRARQLGKGSVADLRPNHLTLLGFPTYLLIREYFPKERHASIWKQSMIENGFPAAVVNRVMLDVFPRDKKNSHAYMSPIQTPKARVLTLNGAGLDPQPQDDKGWSPADIYILENFNDDGVNDLRTAFHEGGHFLDYSFQRDSLGYPRAYGYTETHSTTMENFIADREFLLAHGETREGVKVTPEIVDLFLKRKAVSELMGFRGNVLQAIYDIEVWDYDYARGPLTFTDRAMLVSEKVRKRADFVNWPADLRYGDGYGKFITPHFRSGGVRYFGYVLAAVSAGLMKDSLYAKLEAQTGRASLYHQPGMADMLITGIYRSGFVQPFPRSVEAFTGKSFSPDNYASGLVKNVSDFIDELEKN